MKQYQHHLLQSLPFLAILAVLLQSPSLRVLTLSNLVIQTVLFVLVVIIPAVRTNRMSYVDLGWPIGLFLIGVQVLLLHEGNSFRSWIIAALYLFAGGRMSVMAIIGWRSGWLDKELPRYQYQRMRWDRRGFQHKPALIYEVAGQGLANMTVLAVPAIVEASNPTPSLSVLEIAGYVLWAAAFAFEFVADAQKMRFGVRMRRERRRGEHFAEGLWKYSRHPNYFGEWMVWNALALTAIPSLMHLSNRDGMWQAVFFGAALVFLSYAMYVVLTYYSGAVPAEYYSVKRRPGYAHYQRTTNMFFPGPRKGGQLREALPRWDSTPR